MADSLVTPSGERLGIDLKVSREALAATPGLHVGRLVTVDRVVAKSADKRKLGEAYDALAVDMETYAVAELCRREKVRFMAVRVISDTVDEELPADIGRVAQQRTIVGTLGAVTGAVWRRPASFKDMLRLKQQALIASDRLARFLQGTIAQLPRAATISTERTS
jgi:adenosylhomocysteine nucleosidase